MDVVLEILDSLPFRDDGLIFGVRPDSITHAFERAVRRAGINDITFHDTRHEATSQFFELGLGVQEVAAITGHDDWESLRRYTHPKADRIREKIMRQSSSMTFLPTSTRRTTTR
ncbi:MAG: tyrosine-type recombinase/integrase, partial [Nitrososphaera sp.]